MDKRLIRFRISYNRLQTLHDLYQEQVTEFTPVDDHEELIREHLIELYDKFFKMLVREQEKYTMAFTGAEALAFYQLWTQSGIAIHDQPTTIAVNETLAVIDKKHKSKKKK